MGSGQEGAGARAGTRLQIVGDIGHLDVEECTSTACFY